MRALKMRITVASHQKLTTTSWEPSSKLILLQLHEKLSKNSVSTILWPFGVWSKLERWKSSVSGVPCELTTHRKIFFLKCYLHLFNTTARNHFSIRSWHAMESRFYMTTGHGQLSGWTKKKLQSTFQGQTCTKKDHGHCLVICCPSDPLQLSESWQNHYIWELCTANQWDAPKTTMLTASIG